jgi:hypothetical protein
MKRKRTTRRTSNAEHFAALVEHPYGLAAMELTRETFRRVRWGYEAAGQTREAETMGRAAMLQSILVIEVKRARARARGRHRSPNDWFECVRVK